MTTITHDWTMDVKKYVPNANDAAVKGIIKHLGIALQNKDASFVACSDKSERDRVRESFLKKKLALSMTDAELDQAVMDVCHRMTADRDKSRVAFYYLLAEKFNKLSAFAS
jgi:ribosomal protein S20